MKQPQIDLFKKLNTEWTQIVAVKRQITRLWPKTTVNGVEVFDKLYWYPKSHLEANKVLFGRLGAYNQLKDENPKGIDSAWLYLNPTKLSFTTDGSLESMDGTFIDEHLIVSLERMMPVGVEFEFTVVTKDSDTGVTQAMSNDDKVSHILGLYPSNVNNWTITGDDQNDNLSEVSKFILSDTDGNFNISDVECFSGTITESSRRYVSWEWTTVTTSVPTTIINFKATRVNGFTNTDNIIQKMLEVRNAKLTAEVSNNMYNYSEGDEQDHSYVYNNEFFVDGHMKTSIMDLSVLKSKDAVTLLYSAIDQGYRKKKVKWYKKLFVAIVGFVAAWLCQGCAAYVVATVVAITLALLSMAMVRWGDEAGASFAAKVSSMASTLASILGIMNFVSSLKTKLVEASATEALQREGAKEITKEMIRDKARQMAAKVTIGGIQEYVMGAFSSTMKITAESILKGLVFVSDFVMSSRLESQRDKVNRLNKKLREAEEDQMLEDGRFKDLAQEFIKSNYHVLDIDAGPYKYDYLYEGTYMNVCRKSVNAMDKEHMGIGTISKV